jgi:ankyrin repeat protein
VGCTTSDSDGEERKQPSRATPSTPTAPTSRETEPTAPTKETTVEPEPSRADQVGLDRRLIAAAWDDDVDRARSLIARGADVNAKDDTEQSAYLIATSEGYLDLLELTLRNGAQVNSKDSFNGTGLIRAAERGHWDITGRLVQAGVSIDHVNNLGWTALHEAVILGDGGRSALDTVRVLVAAGVDVNVPAERDGQTAYDHAKSQGYDAIADLLRRAGRVEPGKGGDAADARLLRAASVDDADAVALALRAGADLEGRNARQQTPLLVASARESVEVARILVALGADPDALDYRHDTPGSPLESPAASPCSRLCSRRTPT